MKVIVDPDRCEGHARCVELAPEVFALDDDGYSKVILEHPDESLRAKVEAAVPLPTPGHPPDRRPADRRVGALTDRHRSAAPTQKEDHR